MKRFLFLLLLVIACKNQENTKRGNFVTHFESSEGTETPEYEEVIDFYIALAKYSAEVNIQTIGETDSGVPLHIVTYNPDREFNFNKAREKNTILLINNGIHPGEPDGIDATMLLFRDLALGNISSPKNTVIVAIPVYNIGGALNRNSNTRVNQNGPEEYGFRGNAKNYDLNRDFIKNDTRNARTFAEIFHLVQPDVFVDNHVSNGADYQYTLTHLFTQHNKLGADTGTYLHDEFMPKLEKDLSKKEWDITPYVNVFNRVPENGFTQFMDYPRYSTGYTSLWNTLGLMVETHMLKPYKKRVEGTYELLTSLIDILEAERVKIKEIRALSFKSFSEKTKYPIQWVLDTTKITKLAFKGFEATIDTSSVTGLPRLKYHEDQPFVKEVAYKNYYKPALEINIPKAYVIPQSWWNIIPFLDRNDITYTTIEADTTAQVEVYRIEGYQTFKNPYEGHYPHYNTQVSVSREEVVLKKGDIWVDTAQPGIRYILETLEPQAVDSFFNWNFFDIILGQKEGFSPYVFEDLAKGIIENDSLLGKEFNEKKENDEKFAKNSFAQLNWIYHRSPYYEKAHLRYPVYRIPRSGN